MGKKRRKSPRNQMVIEPLGVPNEFREQHSVVGFERRGVSDQDQRLLKAGSQRAVTYSREHQVAPDVKFALNDHQKIALALYSIGKVAGRGKPTLTNPDGIGKDKGGAVTEPDINDDVERHCIEIAKHLDAQVKNYHFRILKSAAWKGIFPQDDLPKVNWRKIAEQIIRSDDLKEQDGSIKTMFSLVSSEMAFHLHRFWRENPRPKAVDDRLNLKVSEIFSL